MLVSFSVYGPNDFIFLDGVDMTILEYRLFLIHGTYLIDNKRDVLLTKLSGRRARMILNALKASKTWPPLLSIILINRSISCCLAVSLKVIRKSVGWLHLTLSSIFSRLSGCVALDTLCVNECGWNVRIRKLIFRSK